MLCVTPKNLAVVTWHLAQRRLVAQGPQRAVFGVAQPLLMTTNKCDVFLLTVLYVCAYRGGLSPLSPDLLSAAHVCSE